MIVGCAGCSSSDDPANPNGSCKVTCPAGTRCEVDRCIPVCVPPCAADEHCGSDNLCHKGPAPDGGVPPLDSGPPVNKDQGSTKSDNGTPTPDTTPPKPDAGDPQKKLCDCLAKNKTAYCVKPKTCQTSSDCCTPNHAIPCGVYGNKYVCTAGKCATAACQSDGECVTYAVAIKQTDASDYVCHPAICPGGRDYCGPKVKSCSKTSDCCKTGKIACGIYTNHWSCSSGTCEYLGCTSNNECVAYALAAGAANASTWVCRTTTCYNTGHCKPKPKSCSQPSDCCDPGSLVPCGVYSNRYRCENNECVLDGCAGNSDCVAYAGAYKLPDASAYECVTY
jgi:hypothetical protein